MTGMDVVAEARGWIGTRWSHQGRTRDGVDCAGLVIKVAHSLGAFEFDTADYGPQAKDESMLALCREHLEEIAYSQAKPGDIAVMRFGTNRHIGFFADYLHGGLSIVHAFTPARKVIEHGFSEEWLKSNKASLIGVFRFKGVDQ
jgi:cell wall-associated NlpC family hydrolase